ncbi:hypothetical protein F5Y06DRAFT_261623 [Hypoxylon sp. FL0890]|nr:hypothetical protein F5Y06DRAFT_261623 [Hypoxylon sp. FL0890]
MVTLFPCLFLSTTTMTKTHLCMAAESNIKEKTWIIVALGCHIASQGSLNTYSCGNLSGGTRLQRPTIYIEINEVCLTNWIWKAAQPYDDISSTREGGRGEAW